MIIDMVKDNFVEERHLPITAHAKRIIGPINETIRFFRGRAWPIVFSTDAFHPEDFIFKGRMKPHSIAGTVGAEVIDELERREEDLWLPKPRFSAFFGTDLATWLRQRDVTLCAVGGIATNVCVLTTVMDALCHDFKAVLLSDCSAAFPQEVHEKVLSIYAKNPLYPLMRIETSREFMERQEMPGN